MTIVVWFKRDLRVSDHAPLYQAAQQGLPVLPLYVVEPDYWAQPDVSRRHWHFIHDSLQTLRKALSQLGQPLVVRVGAIQAVLQDLKQQYLITTLYSHEETGNAWTRKRNQQVAAWCQAHQVKWQEFPSNGVVRQLSSRDAWSTVHRQRMQAPLIAPPQSLIPVPNVVQGEIPEKSAHLFGSTNIGKVQPGGLTLARRTLDSFLTHRAAQYTASLSKPDPAVRYCSRLSPHIAYGTLSVREIFQASWQRLASLRTDQAPATTKLRRGIQNFLSRLHWRCHFIQKLEDQPEIEDQCMHPAFEGMRDTKHSEEALWAWYEGRTGYPLVDACMRSLHANGWLNFRMRAMVVSFASYDLWLDWRRISPLLAQLFTDYEPGIHYSQLQMQSGVTGINAIRMYDPTKQLRDHDPEGNFVRSYVSELQAAPQHWLTHWGQKQEDLFSQWQPFNYPKPIVNHRAAIAQARARIAQVRRSAQFREISAQVYQKLGSRKKVHRSRQGKTSTNSSTTAQQQ